MGPQPVTKVKGQSASGDFSRVDLRHTNLLQKGLSSPNLTGWICADKVSRGLYAHFSLVAATVLSFRVRGPARL